MTMKAGAGLKVSETYNAAFSTPFPGWRAELVEPVGPSTAGGKQALQPLTLISTRGDRLAIGRLDAVRRQVTLRGHDVLSRMHSERFGQPFAVGARDYQQYLDKVGTFFVTSGYAVSFETPSVSAPQAPGSGGKGLLWVVIAALITAVILLSLLFLLR